MEKIKIEQIRKIEFNKEHKEDFEWLVREIAEKVDNFVELNNFEYDL